MHGWARWINYLDPIACTGCTDASIDPLLNIIADGFEALIVNEFDGRQFPCVSFVPSGPSYTDVASQICSVVGAEPGQTSVSGRAYINQFYQYFHGHLWRNFGILIGFFVFFCTTYLFATEYIPAKKSKGEILVFRSGHAPKEIQAPRKADEEAGTPIGKAEFDQVVQEKADEAVGVIQRQTAIFHWEGKYTSTCVLYFGLTYLR